MDWEDLGRHVATADLDVSAMRGRELDLLRALALARLRGQDARAGRLAGALARLGVDLEGIPTAVPPDADHAPAHDLRAPLATRALAWVDAHLDDFAMPADRDDGRELAGIKALGELGLVIWLLHRAAGRDPEAGAAGERFLAFARRELDDGDRIAPLVERTPALSLLVLLYATYHRLGMRSPALERAIERHLAAVPPSIALMAGRAARSVGMTVPWTDDDAVAETAFGQRRPPWALTRAQVYETTHVVFSLTDYALEPLGSGADYVRCWLPVWLLHYRELGYLDLVAELISTWHCVEAGCVPRAAWQVLADAQRPDGSVPYGAAPGGGADYHSTLMALAAALVCEHNRAAR